MFCLTLTLGLDHIRLGLLTYRLSFDPTEALLLLPPPPPTCVRPQAFEGFLLRCEALDMEALCITPGRFCWLVYLDVVILHGEGNLLDVVRQADRPDPSMLCSFSLSPRP